MEVVEEPDEVFVAVILGGPAKVLIDSALDNFANGIQEAEGSHIGGAMGGPHALGEILIGEEDRGGLVLLVGNNRGGEIFAQNKGVPFGHGPQKLNGGVGIAGIPHILETHHTLVFWVGGRFRRFRYNGFDRCFHGYIYFG